MKNRSFYFIAGILFVYGLSPANCQVINLTPVKDNTIYSEADSSNGAGLYLFSGKTKGLSDRRALLQFDLSSLNESDSILSATLQLYMSKTASGLQNVSVFRLTGDWGEAGSDAIFEEGGGATPATDDATWNYTFYNSLSWANPGGDYNSTPSASQSLDDTGTYAWSEVQLLGDVKKWKEDPDSNFGWILITDGTEPSAKRFNSRENPDRKPVLQLEIMVPSAIQKAYVKSFTVFPNPGQGEMIIRSGNGVPVQEIQVFDISGRKILDVRNSIQQGNQDTYRLFIREKGLYILRINRSEMHKIIIH